MSLVESPTTLDLVHQRSGTTVTTNISADHHNHHQHHHHRLTSKRKLDDYGPSSDDDDDDGAGLTDLVSVRMRKFEHNAVHFSSNGQWEEGPSTHLDARVSNARSPSFACTTRSEWSRSSTQLQFFVRMISEGHAMVIHARATDSVQSLHERIEAITKIPVFEQRLIYMGKQLQLEQSLAECTIQNDAVLHLNGRMRSAEHPLSWQLIEDMISMVCRLCRGESVPSALEKIKSRMTDYLNFATKEVLESATKQFQIFLSLSAPAALVMLYLSQIKGNKEYAENSIKHFLSLLRNSVPKVLHSHCAFIVLELCKLLKSTRDDHLYMSCRSTLGSLLETVGISRGPKCLENGKMKYKENVRGFILAQEIFPFVSELANKLSKDLVSSMQTPTSIGPLVTDIRDFTAFVLPLRTSISEAGSQCPISLPPHASIYKHPLYGEEIEFLHHIYLDLMEKMGECLHKMEAHLAVKQKGEGESFCIGWSQYLTILKELDSISELYEGAREEFWTVMRLRKASLSSLIIRFATRIDDYRWITQHKDVMDFESRRHLAMMVFPDVKEDYEELHEMLIDRSQLLHESFDYITQADPIALRSGLFMEFKNEEATGPGVLREWFFLVCHAIFNPQNALFVACPNDRRRFFPNPASKVDPLHLQYFSFSGRVIALALMHKVQVGVVFDRVFFLQLAGMCITLEDIKDADPYMYSSCKQILEMEAEFIDSDALGLTFVREVEELGSRKVVELCSGGKSMVVNSKNRASYVDLLIQHRFVKSISEQVSHFARGFGDMLCNSKMQKLFFQGIELEDLDWMLHGSERDICVEDWKAHTEYNGYKENDSQIFWFWKILNGMSAEQRKVLLFFWTSIKYLPVEGFRGLSSRLYIYRSPDYHDRLPSSHTCFYRLCFPPYPSMAVMKSRLQVITQEHVGCSFGNW